MNKVKTYFVEVVLGKVAPKVSDAVIASGITFLIAHQSLMEQMGITYYPDFNGVWHGPPPTGRLLVIEFDTLGLWGGTMLIAGFTALYAFVQHHTVATVKGLPQSGDKRLPIDNPVVGGERSTDPQPKENTDEQAKK